MTIRRMRIPAPQSRRVRPKPPPASPVRFTVPARTVVEYSAGSGLDSTAPDQVANMVVADGQDGTLGLTWDAESDASLYKVYRGTSSGNLFFIAASGMNSYTDTSVTLSTTYYYAVSAVDSYNNEGAQSAEDSGSATDTAAPTVTVHQPNGMETLTVGVSFDIEYTASDAGGIDYVQAHYQINGGSWVLIDQDSENTGTIIWTPDTAGSNVLVRVTAYDLAGNSASDTSNATFTIASGSVSPIAPDEVTSATLYSWWKYDDGSLLTTGSIAADLLENVIQASDQSGNSRHLTAVAEEDDPTLISTGLAFSAQDGDRLRNASLAPTHQSGCVFWSGAIALLEGGDQTVLSLFNDSDSNAYLAVGVDGTTGEVFIKYNVGAGDKIANTSFALDADTLYGILWMSTGTSYRIWIDGDEKVISGDNTGVWLGDVPTPEGGLAIAERIASNIKVDQSSMIMQDCGIFAGVPSDGECAGLSVYLSAVRDPILDTRDPVATLTYPNGGEVLDIGSSQSIQWTATDNVTVTAVTLEYSTNNGGAWNTIVADTSNTGTYQWIVPAAASANCLVRITAEDAEGNADSDQSDAVFEIAAVAGGPYQDSGLAGGLL